MIAKLAMILCVFTTGLLLLPNGAKAGGDIVKITPIQLTDQIYMLTGKGGNMGFLIDDQFAPLTKKILAAIKSVGGDVPKFLINTHCHGDHTGGNENLGQAGSLIFSHDNVRQRLSAVRSFRSSRRNA